MAEKEKGLTDKDVATVDFKTQMAGERKLFLGKLSNDDKIPGSDITLKEARENFQATRKEFEQRQIERRARVIKANEEKELTDRQTENTFQTKQVVPGVLVNVTNPTQDAVTVAAQALTNLNFQNKSLAPLPLEAELNKMSVENLTKLAEERQVPIVAGMDKKTDIINRLLGSTSTGSVEADMEGEENA